MTGIGQKTGTGANVIGIEQRDIEVENPADAGKPKKERTKITRTIFEAMLRNGASYIRLSSAKVVVLRLEGVPEERLALYSEAIADADAMQRESDAAAAYTGRTPGKSKRAVLKTYGTK